MIRGRDFIVFSDDWGRHPSSCQHLFRRLAPGNRVLWVNTIGTRTPTLSRADLARAAGKLREWVGRGERPAGGGAEDPAERSVAVVAPFMIPWNRAGLVRTANARLLRRSVSRAAALRGMRDPVLVTTIPDAAGVVGQLGERTSVYYCVDELSEWPGAERESLLRLEAELLERVDLVLASSETLFEAKSAVHPRVRLLRHGVDWARFRSGRGEEPAELASLPAPVAVTVGLIDARLDVGLLAALARARPDVTFAFVGPRQLPPGELDGLANVRFLPPVAYVNVPAVLRRADVALLPYVESALTERINPLKLREMLASGLPIVATPLPEVSRYGDWVRTARGPEAWGEALAAGLAEGRTRAEERAAVVREESWETRAEEFARHLTEAEAAGSTAPCGGGGACGCS